MVALFEIPMVIMPAVQIPNIAGIDSPVQITPPCFRSRFYHAGVVGGKHNRIQFTMQIRGPLDPLLIYFYPPTACFKRQSNLTGGTAGFNFSTHLGLRLSMFDEFR